MGFRQGGEHQHQVQRRHRHRHQQRQAEADLRQQAPEGRAEHEAHTEGHADQAEGLGPLLRWADVGQHGTGGGGRATADAIDQPRHEQQRQRPGTAQRPGHGQGEREATQAEHRAGHATGDHRPPPEAVAEGTDQWGEQELGQGVAARQQPQRAAIAGEAGQQKGQQRKHDALAQPVVEQGEENAEAGGRARPTHGINARQCPYLPMGGGGSRVGGLLTAAPAVEALQQRQGAWRGMGPFPGSGGGFAGF